MRTLAAVVILIGFVFMCISEFLYRNAEKGYRAVNEKEYMAAEKYFDRAIIKDKSRPDA